MYVLCYEPIMVSHSYFKIFLYRHLVTLQIVCVCVCVCVCVLVAQSCPTLCDSCRPGYSVFGILQARILYWLAISVSRDLPDQKIDPGSPALQANSLQSEQSGKFIHMCVCVCVCVCVLKIRLIKSYKHPLLDFTLHSSSSQSLISEPPASESAVELIL